MDAGQAVDMVHVYFRPFKKKTPWVSGRDESH